MQISKLFDRDFYQVWQESPPRF